CQRHGRSPQLGKAGRRQLDRRRRGCLCHRERPRRRHGRRRGGALRQAGCGRRLCRGAWRQDRRLRGGASGAGGGRGGLSEGAMTLSSSRRRFLRITAATAACGLAGGGVRELLAAEPPPATWRGLALGSLASIEIRHADPARAARVLDFAKVEIARLESILGLYRPDSARSRLNRDGILRAPPLDLVQALARARDLGEITGGAFDVTVQPLWQVYA